MAKCVCPPNGKSVKPGGKGGKSSGKGGKSGGKGSGKSGGKAGKSGGKRTANMFILYYLAMWRKHGGNMFCVARECGKRWRTLPQAEKDRYKRQYCTNCRNCRSCTRPKSKK